MVDTLPKISIITPLRNNKKDIILLNFNYIIYPKEQIEWIIIDDGEKPIDKYIPNDIRIKYYHLNKESITNINKRLLADNKIKKIKNDKYLNLGTKLNIGVSYSSNNIIVNYFPNTLYHPKYILDNIDLLLKSNKKCIGSPNVFNFDTKYLISSGEINNNMIDKCKMNSLIYQKQFWIKCKYNNNINNNNSYKFLKSRIKDIKTYDSKNYIVNLYTILPSKLTDEYINSKNGWHFWEIHDELFLKLLDN